MFTAAKDAITSRAAQFYVNSRIERYGEVRQLTIDSRQKTVEVVCLLHGDPSPLTVKIEHYRVEADGLKKIFHATSISCTRTWLQNLLSDYAQNRRIELPAWADGVL